MDGQHRPLSRAVFRRGTTTIPPDIFGSAEATYTATQRLGSDASRLSQIVDGRWKVISEYAKPPQ